MLKILQARLQQYINHELPDVQAGFRKGRGTRDQIANIRWIMEKAKDFLINGHWVESPAGTEIGQWTGKGQFSFQSQRKAMPNSAQTTAQLHSSHMLVK